ncbi:MAG: HDIG domain-containing protein [Thermoguttaceae bacterium]|nr:HDIG domain-containing protein [Thermoguttaceae bacterium]
MPTPPHNDKDRIRTRAQRVASRVAYDGLIEKTFRNVLADNGVKKIGLVLAAAFVVTIICGAWDPPSPYKLGTKMERDVVCRTPFRVLSPDLTQADRHETRIRTVRYFVNDTALLDDYKGELINGLSLILEEPDFTNCSETSLAFLAEFLPPNSSENGLSEIFEALRAYFEEDDGLEEFRKTLNLAFEPYRETGVLRALVSVHDESAAAQAVSKATYINVYEKGADPKTARQELASQALLGSGHNVKASLNEQIDSPEIVNYIANKIRNSIPETLTYDAEETERARNLAELNVEDRYLSYEAGDTIVKAEKVLDEKDLIHLNAEHAALLAERTWDERFLRSVSFFALFSSLMLGAFFLTRNKLHISGANLHSRSLSHSVTFLAVMLFFIGVGRVLQETPPMSESQREIAPFLVFVQLTAIASTWEIALTFGTIAALALNFSGYGGINEFIVFVGTGVIVSLASRNVRTRAQLFGVAFGSAIAAFALSLVVDYMNDNFARAIPDATFCALWCFFAGFFTAGILPVFERFFGILTPMRLLEYSNPSHPLLLELNHRAPATYSHSIQTAALAEPAAEVIGARSALVRVGAYFHDVGKMLQPEHFTENQKGYNIHDELEPRMSALVIIAHTKDGVDLGKRYRLPRQIIDLIEQHHGTMNAGFFYRKACKAAEEKDPNAPPLDEAPFRYPGPIPQTKEAAILMLADSVESASRSLTDWSPRRVENLVRKLVEERVEDRQFNDCGLTLGEIHMVEQSLVSTLLASRHTRIKYPDSSDKEKPAEKEKTKENKEPKERRDGASAAESDAPAKNDQNGSLSAAFGFQNASEK